jgi:hypothetical protein
MIPGALDQLPRRRAARPPRRARDQGPGARVSSPDLDLDGMLVPLPPGQQPQMRGATVVDGCGHATTFAEHSWRGRSRTDEHRQRSPLAEPSML